MTKVFISYSRQDLTFADRLEAALKARGVEVLIDRSEIYAFEDWWKRIEALIAQADTVVFVLSPDGVASDIALKEVAFAGLLSKRFAPVVCRRVDDTAVPDALRRLNFVFLDDETRFEQGVNRLVEALHTDIDWIRKHTDFGAQAQRWATAGRPRGLLLGTLLLDEAEKWIASRPTNAPPPTVETQAFVAESRRAVARRRNLLTASLTAGLLAALSLAGLAYWQRGIAVMNEAQANRERDQALLTQSRFLSDLASQQVGTGDAASAILLALEALPDARGSTRPYAPQAEAALFNSTRQLQEIGLLAGHRDSVVDVAFGSDGRQVVTASYDKTARLWDLQTGREIRVFQGHSDTVRRVAFAPNGRRIATASFDGTVRLWDVETGREIWAVTAHDGAALTSVSISPDGQRIATAGRDTARLWDAESGDFIAAFEGHRGPVYGTSFSPDGRLLVTTSGDKTAILWDLETGWQVRSLIGHSDTVERAAFSPDGRQIVTASDDKTARVWDVDTGREANVLRGHDAMLFAAAFSADGRLVATASRDNTVRLWDAATGGQTGVLSGHTGGVFSVVFSLDGRRIATASADRTEPFAHVYRLLTRRFLGALLFGLVWSGRRDSNPRPRPWQGRGTVPNCPFAPACRQARSHP